MNTKFNIQLPENHTNGYLWQLNNTYDINTVDYMNSVWHGNENGVFFNFESREKGNTELEFNLIKYKDTLETKVFVIEVEVVASATLSHRRQAQYKLLCSAVVGYIQVGLCFIFWAPGRAFHCNLLQRTGKRIFVAIAGAAFTNH